MSKENLYSVVESGRNQWMVLKHDKVLHTVLGHYMVSQTYRGEWLCDCVATKNDCRHIQMLHLFKKMRRVNKSWLYDFDKEEWVED